MSFKDIFKRQVDNLLSTDRNRPNVSLEEDLRDKFDASLSDALDPGRAEREAAAVEQIRTQAGLGQFVTIDGMPGEWEAVELFHYDTTSAAFTLVDRRTGETGQLAAVDDGTVILDSPRDQHGSTIAGAFWRSGGRTGIRLEGAQLTSDGTRSIRITCDLSADAPDEGAG